MAKSVLDYMFHGSIDSFTPQRQRRAVQPDPRGTAPQAAQVSLTAAADAATGRCAATAAVRPCRTAATSARAVARRPVAADRALVRVRRAPAPLLVCARWRFLRADVLSSDGSVGFSCRLERLSASVMSCPNQRARAGLVLAAVMVDARRAHRCWSGVRGAPGAGARRSAQHVALKRAPDQRDAGGGLVCVLAAGTTARSPSP